MAESGENKKKFILFVGEEVTLAHVVRPLYLASALDKEQYTVSFASGDKYKTLIQQYGFDTHILPTIHPDVFLRRLSGGKPLYTLKELKHYVETELSYVSQIAPDLIVGDFRLSLGITADVMKIPYICLSNAHWSPYSMQSFPVPEHRMVKIFGTGMADRILPKLLPLVFWHHARSFNTLRKFFGLPPVGNLKHVYTYGTWTLYTDIPSIAPTINLPQNHSYIGPVIWSPDIDPPPWWNELPGDRHLIYVTMGSSGNIGLLENILDTLKKTPYVGLVATAGRLKIEPSPNIYTADYLPGLNVIKKASAVLCSGGSATAYQALSLGVPILGLPSNADQFYTMESIEKNGAGILVRPMNVSAAKIINAVHHLIEDAKYKDSAQRLAGEIACYNASKLFSDIINKVA